MFEVKLELTIQQWVWGQGQMNDSVSQHLQHSKKCPIASIYPKNLYNRNQILITQSFFVTYTFYHTVFHILMSLPVSSEVPPVVVKPFNCDSMKYSVSNKVLRINITDWSQRQFISKSNALTQTVTDMETFRHTNYPGTASLNPVQTGLGDEWKSDWFWHGYTMSSVYCAIERICHVLTPLIPPDLPLALNLANDQSRDKKLAGSGKKEWRRTKRGRSTGGEEIYNIIHSRWEYGTDDWLTGWLSGVVLHTHIKGMMNYRTANQD